MVLPLLKIVSVKNLQDLIHPHSFWGHFHYIEAKTAKTIGILSKRRYFKLEIVTNAQLIVSKLRIYAKFKSISCVFVLEIISNFPKKRQKFPIKEH